LSAGPRRSDRLDNVRAGNVKPNRIAARQHTGYLRLLGGGEHGEVERVVADQNRLAQRQVVVADVTVTFVTAVVAPTVTINQAVGQADPTSISPILFSVVFSQNVTGFTGSDISLAGSTVGGTLIASVSGSGANYTVSVTGMTGNGTVVASIPAAAAVDGSNTSSAASTSTDNIVAFATPVVAPTVTINQAGGQADPTSSGPILFTVVFSQAVTGFTGSDVSFAGSTVGGL
jgi:hypothetical protein